MKASLGLKRGTWTDEEDKLLRNCIEKYGEGRWHLIPQRAGLKRCRKSCRLRWLNYLKPNIKRGPFEADEVDLIIRMHKLLGNRWALISGRIPGRTANDVKNYWNTNLRKKQVQVSKLGRVLPQSKEQMTQTKIIKPQPRSFSKSRSNSLNGKAPVPNHEDHNVGKDSAGEEEARRQLGGENVWWESLLSMDVDVTEARKATIEWEDESDMEPQKIINILFGDNAVLGDNIPFDISEAWNT